MKLAVCFSGQPRFFELWLDHNSQLYKDCEVDYYAHFWGDSKLSRKIKKMYKPIKLIVEPQVEISTDFPYEVDMSKTTKSMFVTLSPLYSMNKLNEIIKDVDIDYDYWILTRTDIVGQGDSLSEMELEKGNLYTSYVPGEEWLTSHIDTRFICGTKEDILNVTSIYSNLDYYLGEKKIPLCHHRLTFNALDHRKDDMKMLILNPEQSNAGWYFIRNGNLALS